MVFPSFLKPALIIALSAAVSAAILLALLWCFAIMPGQQGAQSDLHQIVALEEETAAENIQRYLIDIADRSSLIAAPVRYALTNRSPSDVQSLKNLLQLEMEQVRDIATLSLYKDGALVVSAGAPDPISSLDPEQAESQQAFLSTLAVSESQTERLRVAWPVKNDITKGHGVAYSYTATPISILPGTRRQADEQWALVATFPVTDLLAGSPTCPHPRCDLIFKPDHEAFFYDGRRSAWMNGSMPLAEDSLMRVSNAVPGPVPGHVYSDLSRKDRAWIDIRSLLFMTAFVAMSALSAWGTYRGLSFLAARLSNSAISADPIEQLACKSITEEEFTKISMFRLLIDANATPIMIADASLGTIAYLNPAAATMLANKTELGAKPLDRIFRLRADDLTRLLGVGGEATRVAVNDNQASQKFVDLRFGPADIGDRKWVMIVISDATDAVKAEQSARLAREQLDETVKRRLTSMGIQRDNYRRTVETLKNFTSTLAHEIKNPIAIILAAAQNIIISSIDPDAIKRAKRIEKRATDMTTIINRILTAVRIEADSLSPTLGEANPLEILAQHAAASAEHDARHTYLFDIEKPDVMSMLDKDLFTLVLSNVLGNAAKYSPEGTAISIRGYATDQHVIIRIADQGIGVPDSEKTKIFTKYYRASTAKKAGITGNGLGMALCKEILEMTDGKIHLEDAPNGGTIVCISLPTHQRMTAAA